MRRESVLETGVRPAIKSKAGSLGVLCRSRQWRTATLNQVHRHTSSVVIKSYQSILNAVTLNCDSET